MWCVFIPKNYRFIDKNAFFSQAVVRPWKYHPLSPETVWKGCLDGPPTPEDFVRIDRTSQTSVHYLLGGVFTGLVLFIDDIFNLCAVLPECI
jgi:hypothetical protein